MKASHLILISILMLALLVGGVGALGQVISANNQTSNAGQAGYNQSASAEWATCYAYKAFDGQYVTDEPAHYWQFHTTPTAWIQQGIPGGKIATAYKIYGYIADQLYNPKNFSFYGSNDGSSFTKLDERDNIAWTSGVPQTFTFENTNSYTWYRLDIESVVRIDGTDGQILELFIYESVPPVASFTSQNATTSIATNSTGQAWAGYAPFTMVFNDTSTGPPTTWNWSYQGYGTNTSTAIFATTKDATATFTTGNFSIKHGANNTLGSNISVQTGWINVSWGGAAAFTKSKASIAAGQSVQFNDTSTWGLNYERPSAWNWSIINQSQALVSVYNFTTLSDARNISHTFANEGIYTVNLSISNVTLRPGFVSTSTQYVTVNKSITANFGAAPLYGAAPLLVSFVEMSTNLDSYAWNWSFGDGTLSTLRNPNNQYAAPGIYSVNLTISFPDGTSSLVRSNYITVTAGTNFTSNQSYGVNNLQYGMAVKFYDNSTGSTTWNWSFGDGGTSIAQHPVYIYDVARKYNVTLNTTDIYGSNSTVKTNYINLTADADSYLKTWIHWNGTNGGTTIKGEEGLSWTPTSVTTSTTQKMFGQSSGWFSEDKSKVSTPSNAVLNFGTGDFTIEQWLYPTASNNNRYIVSRTTSAGTNGWGLYSTGTNNYRFYGGSTATQTPAFTIPLNGWSHVVIERVNGLVTVYINGTATTTATLAGNYDVAGPLVYGDAGVGTITSFLGYIDESRISTVARWGTGFTAPVYEYAGILETIYPDINPDSTLRFKTDPTGQATIANQTDGGTRNRTLQIQYVNFTNYVVGTTIFDTQHQLALEVNLNTSAYTDMTLVSYTIDNTIGGEDPSYNGIVNFNVTRVGGFTTIGDERKSLVDVKILYYNYSPPCSCGQEQYFGSGYLINTTTNKVYPVHNFISTPITFIPWDFYPNFTANVTTGFAPLTVGFTDTTVGFPNIWNWSFGDGQWTNGTSKTPSHVYASPGVYTVSMNGTIWQNMSIVNTSIKTGYITVTEPAPVAAFTHVPSEGFYPLNVQFTDTSTNTPTGWNWSFGDGALSTVTNPAHVYSSGGNYTVNLTVNNSNATYSSKLGYVEVWNYTSNNFAANVTSGIIPFAVKFTDTSANATSWSWIFDGVQTSAVQSPEFTYTVLGTYSVNHSSSNLHHTAWTNKSNYITATELAPVADFSQNVTAGFYSLPVLFNDTSTNAPTSWNWSFGDGSLSILQNVTHVYSSGGTYTVNLTVKNSNATYSTKLGSVEVWNYTTSTFSGTPVSGIVPLTVTFTDTSSNATNWSWLFGDSGTSIEKSPVYTYNTVGTYSINHSANNTHDISWTNKSNYITVNPMVASFTNTTGTGPIPLSVTFNGTSTGSPNTWYWEFGDTGTSTLQNVTHVYTVIGVYGVNFSATNTSSGALDWENKTAYINAHAIPAPVAQFSSYNDVGVAPATFNFTDLSSNTPTAWNWSFGDGGYNTTQNPNYTYTSFGVFDVSLNATNAGGSDTIVKSGYITVYERMAANFSAVPLIGDYPLIVQFTDETNNATIWNWTFGDGTVNATKNPIHTYATAGLKTVNLTASSAHSTDIEVKVGYINVTTNTTPPMSITDLVNTSITCNAITWSWTNPADADFWRVHTYQNNSDTAPGSYVYTPDNTRTWTGLPEHTAMTFSSHTEDTIGNINTTWVNRTETTPWCIPPVPPVADFTGVPVYGTAPMLTTFTDTSTNTPTSWYWTFGDGGFSVAQHPTNLYAANGLYTVTLNATNAFGFNTSTKVGYVNVTAAAPTASFTGAPLTGAAPLTVTFTDASTGTITSYLWDFGDLGASILQNPVHAYAATGTYTVKLTVSDGIGSNVMTRTNYIVVGTPPTPVPTTAPTSAPINPVVGNQSLRISAEKGANYLSWVWEPTTASAGTVPLNVYVDDSATPIRTSYSQRTYLTADLNSGERHTIALYNATNYNVTTNTYDGPQQLMGRATTTTLRPQYEVYFILGLGICLMVLIIFMRELIRLILISLLNIIICLFAVSISDGYGMTQYVFWGIIIITGIIFLVNGIPKIREELNWF